MARALIVGCGCRGRELGRELLAGDWAVRGTTRREDEATAISECGIEAVVADPDRVWTVLEQVADVALIFWLLGSACGDPAQLGAIHGARLERVLEQIVDTPVRGFVYESGGTVEPAVLRRGADWSSRPEGDGGSRSSWSMRTPSTWSPGGRRCSRRPRA